MHRIRVVPLLLLSSLLLAAVYAHAAADAAGARVEERSIQVLTFRADEQTVRARNPSVPQLSCAGGGAMARHELYPTSVQCRNRGVDDQQRVNWHCEADLDARVRFGAMTVQCEGWDHAGDPFIRAGSCALTYALDYAPSNVQPVQPRHGPTKMVRDESWGAAIGSIIMSVLMALFTIVCLPVVCLGALFAAAAGGAEKTEHYGGGTRTASGYARSAASL
jgi:hypothetical protein